MTESYKGQFFTRKDVWLTPQIKKFIHNLKDEGISKILDPFAGEGDLLKQVDIFDDYEGFDIDEKLGWKLNNSLINIPKQDNTTFILTNPPYLAKNSAKRNNYKEYEYFNNNDFQDLYQIALFKCLEAVNYVIAIVPETIIFYKPLRKYIELLCVIEDNPFLNTTCPVSAVCLNKNGGNGNIYKGEEFVDNLENLFKKVLIPKNSKEIVFNHPEGNVGLIALDGVYLDDKIRFISAEELENKYPRNKIKVSSRHLTYIKTDENIDIKRANEILNSYRADCKDLLLCSYRNNNKAGVRRRRLDFSTARAILERI